MVQDNRDEIIFFKNRCLKALKAASKCDQVSLIHFWIGYIYCLTQSGEKHLSYGNGFSCHSKGLRIKIYIKGTVTYGVLCSHFLLFCITKRRSCLREISML
jgi:hypothetical protein